MNRKIVSLLSLVLLLVSINLAYGATTLMEIGRSPFHKPPLTTAESLIEMVQGKLADVKSGFVKAGREDLYEPFVSQLPSARIETVQFQKGSYFTWMFFKRKVTGQFDWPGT